MKYQVTVYSVPSLWEISCWWVWCFSLLLCYNYYVAWSEKSQLNFKSLKYVLNKPKFYSIAGCFAHVQQVMNECLLHLPSALPRIMLSPGVTHTHTHTYMPSFRPHYWVIIIDRVRQGAISCEGRRDGPVINQLGPDEDLPPLRH